MIEENTYVRSVCTGLRDATLYSMKLTEALHSIFTLILGLLIFFYDATFLADCQNM